MNLKLERLDFKKILQHDIIMLDLKLHFQKLCAVLLKIGVKEKNVIALIVSCKTSENQDKFQYTFITNKEIVKRNT